MSDIQLLYPVLAQVALTFVLLIATGKSRAAAVQRGEVRIKDIALGQKAWPDRVTQVSNSFHNQLELPILFYVLIAFVMITHSGNMLLLALAWVFVALRLVHAWIHTTHNRVLQRFYVFLAGAGVLIAMWGIFAVHLIAAGL
jgi:hypothetical protein